MLNKRSRICDFTFLIYEESAVDNWKDRLSEMGLNAYVILHDKDLDKEGNEKKPHYHVFVMLENQKDVDIVINDIIKPLGGVFSPNRLKVMNKRNYAIYLTHRDKRSVKAGKYMYDVGCVEEYGTVPDYIEFIKSPANENEIALAIMDFIDTAQFNNSYYALLMYCRKYKSEWLEEVKNKSFFYSNILKSKQWLEDKGAERHIILDSGEIVEL